jgi:hypothetical protein
MEEMILGVNLDDFFVETGSFCLEVLVEDLSRADDFILNELMVSRNYFVIILSKLELQDARRGRKRGQKTKLQFFNTGV